MSEIKIEILDEEPINSKKFGVPNSGERKPPLSATIVSVTSDNVEKYQDNLGLPTDERKSSMLQRIAEGKSQYFVALDPELNSVAGYTSVNTEEHNLLYIEVAPDYQGRKVGPQLIRGAQEHFHHLSLVNFNGPDGNAFYSKLGFVNKGMPGEMVWNKSQE